MKLQSQAFVHNGQIPQKYTCDGLDVNPPLDISGVPDGAKSLALIADDPDAPAGTWVHWLVWNIDPKTTHIEEDGSPDGSTEGTTSFGSVGYGGPCPPNGEHRYFFKLYALDSVLDLSSSANFDQLENALEKHVIDEAELMGRYSRL